MKLTIAEPKYLKDSISIISELIAEAAFKVTPQSIKLVAMDPANVAMVIFEMFSSTFTEYDVKKDTQFTLNLGYLKQILKRAGQNDTVTLELVDENKFQVTIKGHSKRTFSMSVLEPEEKEQKVPELNFKVKVDAPCSVLNDVVEDASVIMADSVSFVAEGDNLTFLAESDLNKVKIDVKQSDDIKIVSEGKGKVRAKYSIEYLKKLVLGSKISDNVKISLSDDYPLKLEYVAVDKVQLAFVLAPRVEND